MPTPITLEQFRAGLTAIPGCVILRLTALVVPEMRKKANPYFGRVTKRVVANGSIGADYEASTNRALVKRGDAPDFKAGPHPWGDYVNKAFVQDASKAHWYIRFFEKSRVETWLLDGRKTDPSRFEEFVRQTRDVPVKYRNFRCDHISSIKWRGRLYTLVHERE